MLLNWMDRDVIPLLSHYPAPADMEDYDADYDALDPDTAQAINEQHAETVRFILFI